MNVQIRVHTLRTFVNRFIVHIHWKMKIALEITGKISSENGFDIDF